MIALEFHNQKQLLCDIGDNLTGEHPTCWDVVIPPGFGEERFARQLEDYLRSHSRRPRVAVQGADHSNPSIAAFIHALHWQWSEKQDAPPRLHQTPSIYFDMLLKTLQQSDRPLILVLKRFHKVLDNLDKWVLGKLRTEEQNNRLQTVVLTPLPLPALKRRWESKHYFSTSDYGDSRHQELLTEPPTLEETIADCAHLDVPDWIANYAYQLSGGYPEHQAQLLEWWTSNRRPQLKPAVRADMLRLAQTKLTNFLEWLDPLEDGQYRDCVIDLYHGYEADRARDAFHIHPWRSVVLNEHGLRAEALGSAALSAALLETEYTKNNSRSPWSDVAARSRRLYERRQYQMVVHVLDAIDPARIRAEDRMLHAHAQVMVELAGGQGNDHFGGDSNCKQLRRAVQHARTVLATAPLRVSDSDRKKIEGRYEQLEGVAEAITMAGSVHGRFENRLVEVLAGYAGESHQHPKSAALLLLMRAAHGKLIAGDGTACQVVLPLPEQIFCTWALWALKLNYYRAPTVNNVTWDLVEQSWPSALGKIQRTSPGEEFSSFFVFAYYSMAHFQSLPPNEQPKSPEVGLPELQSSLSNYQLVRNGHAHGLYQPPKRQRQMFFTLIDRWLDTMFAVCPEPVTRAGLLELTETLPVVAADGSVAW